MIVLKPDEKTAWDEYAASSMQAILSCWFRWKMGIAIDTDVVIAEGAGIADALVLERRKR